MNNIVKCRIEFKKKTYTRFQYKYRLLCHSRRKIKPLRKKRHISIRLKYVKAQPKKDDANFKILTLLGAIKIDYLTIEMLSVFGERKENLITQ